MECLVTPGLDGDLNCHQKSGKVPSLGKDSGWLGRKNIELVKPLFNFVRTGLNSKEDRSGKPSPLLERRRLKSLVLQELSITTEAAG